MSSEKLSLWYELSVMSVMVSSKHLDQFFKNSLPHDLLFWGHSHDCVNHLILKSSLFQALPFSHLLIERPFLSILLERIVMETVKSSVAKATYCLTSDCFHPKGLPHCRAGMQQGFPYRPLGLLTFTPSSSPGMGLSLEAGDQDPDRGPVTWLCHLASQSLCFPSFY